MNILFFLTPKVDVGYVYSSDTVGQAIDKMLKYQFTTVPVLNEVTGRYEGTLANDDLLRELYRHPSLTISAAADRPLRSMPRRRDYSAVRADADMEDLLASAVSQNFVPRLYRHHHPKGSHAVPEEPYGQGHLNTLRTRFHRRNSQKTAVTY